MAWWACSRSRVMSWFMVLIWRICPLLFPLAILAFFFFDFPLFFRLFLAMSSFRDSFRNERYAFNYPMNMRRLVKFWILFVARQAVPDS